MTNTQAEGTPELREKAIHLLGVGTGGRLTLRGARLSWKRSPWGAVGLLFDKGPASLDVDLSRCVVANGGRRLPWTDIILSVLGPLGIILILAAMRPYLFLGPLNLILMLIVGAYRKTLEVRTADGTFYFSVRAVDTWLESCEKAAREHGLPSPLLEQPAAPYPSAPLVD